MDGQYVAYTFFRVDPSWRRLPVEERAAGKDAFAEVVEEWSTRMDSLRAYTLTGVRPDSDFFLWKITQRYDDLGEVGTALNSTPLAGWLDTPYSYLATTKASEYTKARRGLRDDPQPHDILIRDRRPGVHDGVRVRRAGRLHAPDAHTARDRGFSL